MEYNLTEPCRDCPFRNDRGHAFFMNRDRAEDIVEGILTGPGFPCHKTATWDDEGEQVLRKHSQHCAGALIMCENEGTASQMMRIAERIGVYDHQKLNMDAPVYGSFDEFFDHQDYVYPVEVEPKDAPLDFLPPPIG